MIETINKAALSGTGKEGTKIMKTISLQKLQLTNFMRFRDFTFEPNGQNATIACKNRGGKTTLAHAFSYALFGKDIYDNPENQFSLKTKDENDQIIPMIDHIVENTLSVDGEPLILKRNYLETRTKKNRKLTGHTTDYWINGEPDVKKKDFEAKIAEIISFDLFKLLTSVTAFADLPWKTLRKQLFRICWDVKEDALGEAEKAKKIVASKKEEIEKKKKFIPARIDEKNKDLAALADLNKLEIQARIDDLDKQIQDIKTDSTRAVLMKEQAELETTLSQIKAGQEKEKQEATSDIHAEIEKIYSDCMETRSTVTRMGHYIEFQKGIIEAAETEISGLYEDWDRITEEEPEILDLCPTCQKPFLSEEKDAVQQKFNLQQSKKKEGINSAGKEARARKEKAVAEKIELDVTLKQYQLDLAKIEKDLDKKKAELEDIVSPPEKPKGAVEVEAIGTRLSEIDRSLEQKDQSQNMATLESELKVERAKIAKLDTIPAIEARIEELKTEEKTMAAAIEKLENDLSLSEQKLEKEARLVEETVNKKFKVIKFQLFREHLNTSVDPCCKILINGNEHGHGTSTSEEIRGGADFIRVLSEFHGISCPLFLDRAESLTDPLPEMNCQIISLIVDKNKEELEITYE